MVWLRVLQTWFRSSNEVDDEKLEEDQVQSGHGHPVIQDRCPAIYNAGVASKAALYREVRKIDVKLLQKLCPDVSASELWEGLTEMG